MGQGLESGALAFQASHLFGVNKPDFSRGSGRNLKVLNFIAVNTKNPF